MLRWVGWLVALLAVVGYAAYNNELEKQLQDAQKELEAVRRELKPLEARIVPVEKARASIHQCQLVVDVKREVTEQATFHRRLLQGLRGLPVEVLEFGHDGYYVETRDVRVLAGRLKGLAKPSTEPARLAGRWK